MFEILGLVCLLGTDVCRVVSWLGIFRIDFRLWHIVCDISFELFRVCADPRDPGNPGTWEPGNLGAWEPGNLGTLGWVGEWMDEWVGGWLAGWQGSPGSLTSGLNE